MTSLNIVFAGTPEFTLPCLERLGSSAHRLQAVYTQPDRPAGRGRKLQISAVKQWALTQNIPVYQPINFKTAESVAELAALEPDVLIVIAYGLILPKTVLAIPRFGCINVHASLLPRWRGASPIQHAVLHGDAESGVTVMQMDVGMDTGASLAEVSCAIAPHETAGSLHDKLAQLAVEPLLSTLDALAKNQAVATPQNNQLATYAGKIRKEHAAIDWTQSAETIDRKIRAFNPWPIAWARAGNAIIRIHQAMVAPVLANANPGTILAIDKTGMHIATGHHVLCVQRIQFAGGKIISIADWINSGQAQSWVHQVLK